VEHLPVWSSFPTSVFAFFAVPVKVKGMGTFPVRAFGLVEDDGAVPKVSSKLGGAP